MTDVPAYVPSSFHRFLARLVDGGVMAVGLYPAFGGEVLNPFFGQNIFLPWPLLIYLVGWPLAYETLTTWLWGATPGKWVFGLRVVSARGGMAVNGPAALLRAMAGRLGFFFWHAIHALALLRYDRTHVVDWIAGTRVVSEREILPRPQRRVGLAVGASLLFFLIGWSHAGALIGSLSWEAAGVSLAAPHWLRPWVWF